MTNNNNKQVFYIGVFWALFGLLDGCKWLAFITGYTEFNRITKDGVLALIGATIMLLSNYK